MNKWKDSFGAKVGAWIGITLSAVIIMSGIAGVMLMLDAGVYDTPRQEFHREAYESVANQYTIRALEALQTGKKYRTDSTYFRYGIIKAEEIEGLDLSDESIYLEKNFAATPKLEELAFFHYRVGENTKFEYSLTLFGGYALYDENAVNESTESIWVVVELPQSVATGWSEDLFVQANTLTELMYNLRYSIFAVIAVAFGLGIFFFAFLLRAAGHRKGTDEITAGAIDRMPFDIYLCFAFAGEMLLFCIFLDLTYHVDNIAVVLILCCQVLAGGWLLLFSFLTFAVRIKMGKWWRNTVIYFIFNAFYKFMRFMVENISMIWKAILLFAAVTFLEFLFMAYTVNYGEGPLLLLLGLEALQLAAICFGVMQAQRLKTGGQKLADGDMEHRIDTERMYWEFKQHGENLNSIRAGMSKAVDERMKSERFKTELITNVSHDIKTPLTSIINYVDLLEKEELNNETAEEYLEVLERQSARLKKLIEDLMEASKASTGNLTVNVETLEAGVSIVQIIGEFEEKMKANDLELLIKKPENPVCVRADSRHFWRVIDNLMNNICKYAQPSTRVYIDLEENESSGLLTFRNTSRFPLNISSEELMERFVRGDSSRNTEGSGLGISIAKSLMELMDGTLDLYIDGDLFKVILTFKKAEKVN